MTGRNRTQEEHATLEEQTSTHIQMIISATEASNKKLTTTITSAESQELTSL